MSKVIRAEDVNIGDRIDVTALIGHGGWHAVAGWRYGPTGDVLIDVEDGNLIAALPPLEPHQYITIE